jgi:hypothetical protein
MGRLAGMTAVRPVRALVARPLRSFTLGVVLLLSLGGALIVGSIAFPEKIALTPEGPELVLNGAGERRIFLLKIYAIGLYLPRRARSMDEALSLDGPKRMHLVMLRNGITAKQVHDHVVARIEDGSQPSEMALMKARIDGLDRIIEAERVINQGGTIDLDYLPGVGTIIRVNGIAKGEPIPGEDFYKALLRIWLGDKAKSLHLRDQLLGKPV